MKGHIVRFACLLCMAGITTLYGAGCATQDGAGLRLGKTPEGRHSQHEEGSRADQRSVEELLAEAESAHRAANEAFEQENYEAALRNYTRMMELMLEADLDPSVFYDLRQEFGQILAASARRSLEGTHEEMLEYAEAFMQPGTGLDIPDPLPEWVQEEIRKIQNSYAGNFQRGLDRSGQYEEFVRDELAKAGLPQELFWLAMVESQFWPRAVSRAGAAGMWQFMPGTGRRYGLRIDNYVDERFNVEKSTRAAIAYLTDLRDMFGGNWPLAVSSYNMGEFGMERAIAMNGGDEDLWTLIETPPAANVIRQETKEFYPKLLASIIVASNPEEYGFTPSSQTALAYERVPVRASYQLSALERESGLESGALTALNPDLIRGVTPPSGEFMLAVPEEAAPKVVAALQRAPRTSSSSTVASAPGTPRGSTTTHVVRRGETLSEIAARYRVPMRDIQRANNIQSASRVRVNQRLTIPGAAAPAEAPASQAQPASSSTASASTPRADTGSTNYRVRRGDTLYEIAKAHNVSVNDLRQWNSIRGNQIYAGQELRIRGGSAAAGSGAGAPQAGAHQITHVVRSGEYPAKVAQQYGVKVDDLLAWNSLNRNSVLHIGDRLTVHTQATLPPANGGGSAAQSAPAPQKKTYKVARGDSPWTIANRHKVSLDDFLKWNNLTRQSVLRVGQEVVIYTGGSAAQSTAQATRVEHTVRRGENPTSIARRYGVTLKELYSSNGWTSAPTLYPGQKLVILKK